MSMQGPDLRKVRDSLPPEDHEHYDRHGSEGPFPHVPPPAPRKRAAAAPLPSRPESQKWIVASGRTPDETHDHTRWSGEGGRDLDDNVYKVLD